MVVEDLDLRIMGIVYTKGITLLDKGFADWGREGLEFLMKPEGTECLEAVWRILRKMASPWEQEEGSGAIKKRVSVSRVKVSQSALRKLWKVLTGRGFLVTSGRERRMRR